MCITLVYDIIMQGYIYMYIKQYCLLLFLLLLLLFPTVLLPSVEPIHEENPWAGPAVNGQASKAEELRNAGETAGWSRGEEWLSQINSNSKITNGTTTPPPG